MSYSIEVVAANLGRVVRYAKPNELFIDLDSDDEFKAFLDRYARMRQFSDLLSGYSVTPSPSGRPGRSHVVVQLTRDFTANERILLEACLGSDPARAWCAMRELAAGRPEDKCSVFFERPAP